MTRYAAYRNTAAALLAAALAACATPPAPPEPVVVKVPVPQPCSADEPAVPSWAFDQATKAMDVGEQVKRLRAESRQRQAYEGQLLAALRQCTGKLPEKPAP